MAIFFQLIVNGLIAGAIYALMASGFSLIYNIKKFFHIAHGAIFVAGAYFAYTLVVLWKVNFVISFILTLIFAGLLGLVVDYLIYKPLRKHKENELAMFLGSFAVFIFITNFILLIYRADIRSFMKTVTKGNVFFGAVITELQIILLIVSIVAMIGLYIFLKKTKMGVAMRASADNQEMASAFGVNSNVVTITAYIIGSGLAAIAGILIGYEQNIEPNMGFSMLLKGVIASIIGGVGNVPASVLGGFFLGMVENVSIWWLPSGYKDAISFFILILFLIFRPRGLFGSKKREEVTG